MPDPGAYSSPNKWNKRTFNLKFLNKEIQSQEMSSRQLNVANLGGASYMPTL